MENNKKLQVRVEEEEDEEAKASIDIWRYAVGFVDVAVVKCAIDLRLPEAVEDLQKSQPVTLAELSAAVTCPPQLLRRMMRFLAHQGIFREVPTQDGLTTGYVNTPLSRRMMITNPDGKSMAPLILLACSPVILASWLNLSGAVSGSQPYEAVQGKDAWAYAAEDPSFMELFNEAMVCDTVRVVPVIAGVCADAFEGVETVVDVGGGTGEALRILVKEFPWIKGINFDLPHVIAAAENKFLNVENVGGDMFDAVPEADAVFIKWVLHDWNDEDCIKILRKCREAIPEERGKVMIVEAVMGKKKMEEEEENKLEYAKLCFDMLMMNQLYKGKERNMEEWDYVLAEAGFAQHQVRDINDFHSVIIAYV